MPCGMKVSDWINCLEGMNERLPLIDGSGDELSERETICKVIAYSQYPKSIGKGLPFERRRSSQEAKRIKDNIENNRETHRNDAMEQELSGNKKFKEPAPTDINKCRLNLIGRNHFWKNCPNNPYSKNYNRTHYSKVRDQKNPAGTPAISKNEDKSDDESKRPHKKKRHRDKERREVSSLNSIDSNNSLRSHHVIFSRIRDSVGSARSTEYDSIESLYSKSPASRGQVF